MPKIAITGASGYLGSYLSNELSKKGHKIVKLQRKLDPYVNKNFEQHKLDLNSKLTYDFKNIEILIHCAYDFKVKDWNKIKYINIEKSVELIKQAKNKGVKKIFFISSQSAFKNCKSSYGKAKFEVEKKIQEFDTIILRPGLIVGDELGGIVKKLYNISRLSFFLPIPYSKKTVLYTTNRNDILDIISKIFELDIKISIPINVSNNNPLSLEEVIKDLLKSKNSKYPFFIRINPIFFYIPLFIFAIIFRKARIGPDNLLSLINTNPSIEFNSYKHLQKMR